MESPGGHGAAVRFVAEVSTDICGWGQEVRVCSNHDKLWYTALQLTTFAVTVPIWISEPIAIQSVPDSGQIEYKLLVHDPSGEDRWERAYGEVGQHRTATIMEGHLTTVHDRWDQMHHTKVTISPLNGVAGGSLGVGSKRAIEQEEETECNKKSRRDVYAQTDIELQDISRVSNHELLASVQKALQDRIAKKEVLGVKVEEADGGEEHEAGHTDSMGDGSVEVTDGGSAPQQDGAAEDSTRPSIADRVVDWMGQRTPSEQAAMEPILQLIDEERYEEAGEEIRRKFDRGKSGQEIIDEVWVQPAVQSALQELQAAFQCWKEAANTGTDKTDKTMQDYARIEATQMRSKLKDYMRDRRKG
ncbi:unnamed protein product [Vitrella brassicaformis CCMP3155]|uniref:CBM20 domain-containing protein n=2 Tax=Vitrella brassicaformis TaxID=1169539 RepID=A0A0G4GVL6_VITBC|nr:unnamed protein product [Vitrella brassicaformis CCMP3155]|eukprot:CEM34994.1 unnamed protein product [Vitrella brassicaformis CCMP3155]